MIRIGFDRSWATGGWDIYAHRYTGTGSRIPYKITITEMPEVKQFDRAEPSYSLEGMMGQEIVAALIQGLTEAGLMPPMGATEAELKATIRHLSDLRSLVFEQVRPAQEIKP